MLVPRITYLSLLSSKIKEYFQSFIPTIFTKGINNNEIWFEYENNPLKWFFYIKIIFYY